MTTEVTSALYDGDASPQAAKSMIDRLVTRGFAREAAEDLCATSPPPDEGDIESWIASVTDKTRSARREILEEHHKEGIPPLEPPPLQPGD